MGGKGSGRPIKYRDKYHKMWRENQRRYWQKNREVILYAMKHKISLGEARKQLIKQGKRNDSKK